MNCDRVQEQLSWVLDGESSAGERENVLAHVASCRVCNNRREAMESMRVALGSMDRAAVPPRLSTKLRVIASHERVRQLAKVSLRARITYTLRQVRLSFDNLMKPLALPIAGGLASTLLMFATLLPNLNFNHTVRNDVPLPFYTDPTLEEANPVLSTGDQTIVQLTIDERGRVTDYSVEEGSLTPEIKALILFSRFAPATLFGQPIWGKALVSFGRSHIVVRG
jgi:hypothetical protein